MKYQWINLEDDLKIRARHAFTRKTLKYVCQDDYDVNLFFESDELYPISRSERYDACVHRLKQAIDNKEKVVVYGDYDVDGISATTICYDMLTNLGLVCGYYIPNRMIDGYGLTKEKVSLFHEKGYSLIICVDNGVVAHEAIAKATKFGMDVIIIDHHEMDEKTLEYPYVIHSDVLESHFAGMCGAGLVFEFSRSFLAKPQYVMLAALGTIADMMVLVNENRRIVRHGLRLLNEEGFINLTKFSKDASIDEFTLAMQVAPKLNTLGRLPDLANTNQVVRYFMSTDVLAMDSFMNQVEALNEKRKQMAKDMTMLAETMMEGSGFEVIVSDAFHEGLVGLVANQLLYKYGKPVMVCHHENGICKGSLRSIDGLDLVTMMRSCPNVIKFGGHKSAGGITFALEHLASIKSYIFAYMSEHAALAPTRKALALPYQELTLEGVLELAQYRPLLMVSKEPLYVLSNVTLSAPSELSGGLHLKWQLSSEVSLMYFNHAFLHLNHDWQAASFVVKVTTNTFRNKTNVSLIVQDVVWDQ